MLPHRCILSNCRGAFELVRPLRLRDEIYLSYLPLSHSYEHTVGNFFFASLGSEIVYSRGVEHLAADMLAIRPTLGDEVLTGRKFGPNGAWPETLRSLSLDAKEQAG
jgi:long-subunit acyl-CoA synthetase (AMP-forming)